MIGLNSRDRAGAPANTGAAWEEFIRAASEAGINHFRVFLLETPWIRPETVRLHPEFCPWVLRGDNGKYDLRAFEPACWNKLDMVLRAALEHQVVVEIVVFDEMGLDPGKSSRWANHPFNSRLGGPIKGGPAGWPAFYNLTSRSNLLTQERYVRFLLTRTAAYPNIFFQINNEMGGDGLGDTGAEWLQHWVDFFHENDPFQRPLSLSTNPQGRSLYKVNGIRVVNLSGAQPERLRGIEKPQVLATPAVRDDMLERELVWTAMLLRLPASRRRWQPLDKRDGFLVYARGLRAMTARTDAWLFRSEPERLLGLPIGLKGVVGKADDSTWIYLAGRYRGQGMLRIGVKAAKLTVRWYSPSSGKMIRENTLPSQDGVLGLRPPDFSTDMLPEVFSTEAKPVRFPWNGK